MLIRRVIDEEVHERVDRTCAEVSIPAAHYVPAAVGSAAAPSTKQTVRQDDTPTLEDDAANTLPAGSDGGMYQVAGVENQYRCGWCWVYRWVGWDLPGDEGVFRFGSVGGLVVGWDGIGV